MAEQQKQQSSTLEEKAPSSSSFSSSSSSVPDEVEKFLIFFRMHLQERNVGQLQSIYDVSFPKLTERYYKNSNWPPVAAIAPLVDQDELLLMLYRELSFRHMFRHLSLPASSSASSSSSSSSGPSLQNHFDSWENYSNLFNYFLRMESGSGGSASLELPISWLWDMVDEFVHQFQSFCQFRGKVKSRTLEEKQLIKAHPQVWDIASVIRILSLLSEKVDGVRISQMHKHESVEEGKFSLLHFLGFFSLICLAHVHVLIGDYNTALSIVDSLDLRKGGVYQKNLSVHLTLCYLVGFCQLMTQRFRDAIRTFNTVFQTISRSKQTRSNEHLLRLGDRVYGLVAIALSLSPQRLEEHVENVLRDKIGDKLARIQQGHEGTYEELFSSSCPQFITIHPTYEEDQPDFAHETLKLQLKMFMEIVRQQSLIPVLRSYLKLYQTIPISKLADYLEMSEEEVCTQLINWKSRSQQVGGPSSMGKGETAEIHFWIEKDMVHVKVPKTQRRQADYFITQISKMEMILNEQQKGGGSR